ncbi:hypothetical protein [Streptomyces sp. NPDC002851]
MDTFGVQPGDLDGYAKLIDRAGDDMVAAVQFVRDNVDVEQSGAGSVIWDMMVDAHRQHSEVVSQTLALYKEVLTASSDELVRSAQYYRSTDKAEAARQDATYPATKTPDGPDMIDEVIAGSLPSFRDTEDAQSKLKMDADPGFGDRLEAATIGRVESGLDNSNGTAWGMINAGTGMVLDLASPTALINEGLKLLGWDPLGDLAQTVGGNWEGFSEAAQVWGKLAAFSSAVSTNVQRGAGAVCINWNGMAADVAFDYFNGLAEKIAGAKPVLEELDRIYLEMAGHISSFIDVLKAAMTLIGDLIIQAVFAAAAGSAAATTGVGLFVTAGAYAVVGKRIMDVINVFNKTMQALTMLYVTMNSAQAAGQNVTVAKLDEMKKFPKPGGSYDNKLV